MLTQRCNIGTMHTEVQQATEQFMSGLPVLNMEYAVYVLICPITKQTRYVGSTRQPVNRFHCHTTRIHRQPKTPVEVWTSEMIAAGTPPIFRIVSTVKSIGRISDNHCHIYDSCDGIHVIEKQIIRRCLVAGCDLLNVQLPK